MMDQVRKKKKTETLVSRILLNLNVYNVTCVKI